MCVCVCHKPARASAFDLPTTRPAVCLAFGGEAQGPGLASMSLLWSWLLQPYFAHLAECLPDTAVRRSRLTFSSPTTSEQQPREVSCPSPPWAAITSTGAK